MFLQHSDDELDHLLHLDLLLHRPEVVRDHPELLLNLDPLCERRQLLLERTKHDVGMHGGLGDRREATDEGVQLLEAVADEVERIVVLEQRLRVAQRLDDRAGVAAGDIVAEPASSQVRPCA